MPISNELIDKLLEGHKTAEDIVGGEGLLQQLTKRIAERAQETEMSHHLGCSKNDPAGATTAATPAMARASRKYGVSMAR